MLSLERSILPPALLQSLTGVAGYQADRFEAVHQSGEQVTSIRYHPLKWKKEIPHFTDVIKVPWSSNGYYLSKRPVFTLDPLLHAGVYYVQEASSMFLETALLQTTDINTDMKVLDLSLIHI